MLPRRSRVPRPVFPEKTLNIDKTDFWSVNLKPNNLPYARFAVIIGSAFGNSVVRHKFKRIVSDIVGKWSSVGTGDFLIRIKPGLAAMEPDEIKERLNTRLALIFKSPK